MRRYVVGGELLLAFDAAYVLDAADEDDARAKAEEMSSDHHVDWDTMTVHGFSARVAEETDLPAFPEGGNCEGVPPHVLSGGEPSPEYLRRKGG